MNLAPPVAMSQTKDELLRHLNLPLDTYNRMAKETDEVYVWLTSERRHLKKNCQKVKPPYDWSDVKEKSKDEAIERIANSNDYGTRVYWALAQPVIGCPNWIARWFLYHKFRYRDGRNRNPGHASSQNTTGDGSSRKARPRRHEVTTTTHGYQAAENSESPQHGETQNDGNEYYRDRRSSHTNAGEVGSTSLDRHADNDSPYPAYAQTHYPASHDYATGYTAEVEYDNRSQSPNKYWDPVRDARNTN